MLKIVRKKDVSKINSAIITLLGILAAFIFTGIFLLFLGYSPVNAFYNIIAGAFGSPMRFRETLTKTIPILITSLGIAIPFKLKFWNIGAEGQITMGALFTSFVALNFSTGIPKPLMLTILVISGFIGGAFWGIIPAIFKVKFNTNETISTLMLNYIAIKIVQYLQYGPWKDPASAGFPKIPNFEKNCLLPKFMGVNIGLEIAIVLGIIVYIMMAKTKLGYEIAVAGQSENTAKYSGMDVSKITITSMIISGGICGIVGMIFATGVERTLTYNIAGGYGFTAIITAWLSGLNAIYIFVSSVLFAGLLQGGNFIQISMEISSSLAEVLQGIILFFVLGSGFFKKYKIIKK